jgi:hypothetical protein
MSPQSGNSEVNQHAFHIQQHLGRIATIKLVKVTALTGGGGAKDVAGTVDVQPLTKQMDGEGNTQSHGKVYGLTYLRLQTGTMGVIHDPAVGDIGIAAICDRDISANVANRGEAQPGSHRRFSMSDGIYLGGVLNAKLKSYLRLLPDGSWVLQPIEGDNLSPAAKWDTSDKKLYLGGDPEVIPKTKFAPVSTSSGPCINVNGRWQV